jgi:hypothetical protein
MVGFVPDVNPKLLGNAPLRYVAGRTLRLSGNDIPPGTPLSEEQIQHLGKRRVESLLNTRHLRLVPLKEILPSSKASQPVVTTAAIPAEKPKSAVAATKPKAAFKPKQTTVKSATLGPPTKKA